MNDEVRYWVVIPAAGAGRRMQVDIPKQYIEVHGKAILEHTLNCFIHRQDISGVVVAISPEDEYWPSLSCSQHKKVKSTQGGKERFHSVFNGLLALRGLADKNDWVMVHDAARPCLSQSSIDALIKTLLLNKIGGLLASPCRDTMKRANNNNEVEVTIDRDKLWHAQTPQMFRYQLLFDALESVIEKQLSVTDEAMAVELLDYSPTLIEGNIENIKITHKDDLKLAEIYLK